LDTEALIKRLSENAKPTQPLANPWLRALAWLAISVPCLMAVIVLFSPRADLGAKLIEARFLIEQSAALATAFTAAIAAFASTIPGYDKKYLILPVVPLAAWLATLGIGCFVDLSHSGFHLTVFHADWFCLPGIVMVGALPGLAIVFMLRRGAPLSPASSTMLGGLAAAALGDFGLRFFHPEDTGLLVLVWQFGSVFLLSVLSAWIGRHVLNWKSKIEANKEEMLAR